MRIRLRWMPVALLLAAPACEPTIGPDVELHSDLERAFADYTLVRVSPDAQHDVEVSGRLVLPLATGDLELVLERRDLRAPDYVAEITDEAGTHHPAEPADARTYTGRIGDDPATPVRLAISERGVTGMFVFDDARYFMEPARTYSSSAANGALVVYKAEDALHDGETTCSHIGQAVGGGISAYTGGVSAAIGGSRIIEVATDADTERIAAAGGPNAANVEILEILNMVEGVYQQELGLTFSVTYQNGWWPDTGFTRDPYTASTPEGMLQQFRATWEMWFPRDYRHRDVAHLFSANPVMSGRGYATIDVICRAPDHAYGISGHVGYQPVHALIAAHEIAHNIGAEHRDGGDCASSVMNSELTYNTPFTFCGGSRGDITSAVARHGSCLAEGAPLPGPEPGPPQPEPPQPLPTGMQGTPFDFDGDGRADISVFRPSNGTWYVSNGGGASTVQWGSAGDRVAAADYDGDAITDHAVYRDGTWWVWFSGGGGQSAIEWGVTTDIPVPADYDGDGRADLAVFRPGTGEWWVRSSSDGGHYAVQWGQAGDVPVPGDTDGDGRADYNVFRSYTGIWYRMGSASGSVSTLSWGLSGDIPVAADFDGDGINDAAVWRESDTNWYVINSSDGSLWSRQFGEAGDIPVAADYDGDGHANIAVFRPSTGQWFQLTQTDYLVTSFGQSGDLPVPALP